jgi:hypothetical protein
MKLETRRVCLSAAITLQSSFEGVPPFRVPNTGLMGFLDVLSLVSLVVFRLLLLVTRDAITL